MEEIYKWKGSSLWACCPLYLRRFMADWSHLNKFRILHEDDGDGLTLLTVRGLAKF